jgi:transposase
MQISTIGIDIGKNSVHFVGFDARGGIVVRRQCSRTQLIRALANLPPCLVEMEACCGAHHFGRILVAQGHDVRLIPPHYVKPFVKSQKNDSWMPKRLVRRSNGRPCRSCPSRRWSNWICKRSTGSARVSSRVARR